ncbi:MAG: rod shape-determining protein MreD [Pseudomonadales bacterium]|nr:rod shape-determining protein MreD [Pseudomonadales bacterium]
MSRGGGWIIVLSCLIALVLGVVHLPSSWPHWLGWFRPAWLILVLFFWVVEVPSRVGLFAVWCLGLPVDILQADPLGLNGFILASVAYIGQRFSERLRMYSMLQQACLVFVLVLASQWLRVLVLGISSERAWGWDILSSPLISMLAWPAVFLLLLRIRTGARIE